MLTATTDRGSLCRLQVNLSRIKEHSTSDRYEVYNYISSSCEQFNYHIKTDGNYTVINY